MDKKVWVYIIAVAAVSAVAAALITYALTPKGAPAPRTNTSVYNATVHCLKSLTVNYTGYWRVPVCWVNADGDVVLWLNVTVPGGRVYSVYIDGAEYSNPATAVLNKGTHTVEVLAYIPGAIDIIVEYKVLS